MMRWLRNSLVVIMITLPAHAFEAEQRLADPAMEARAQEVFKDIRCVVCEGESLAESSADMAYDMRAMIRKQIAEGKSPTEVKAQFVANYGEQVLQTPPVTGKTFFLWFTPFIMLIIGAIWLITAKGRKKV
jgi:cytochrome c-type biogenesis protein CcmH